VSDLVALVASAAPEVRRLAAARWLDAARAEHASIASFSRFTLQLIAVGAPAELLERSHQAGLDEIRHARVAFTIASAYAGTALGPGPLALGRDEVGYDLGALVRGTIEEGCVGETLAALEAEAARDHAACAELRDALDRIHDDEGAHARLAFQTVSWGLATDPTLRGAAREAFARTLERHRHESLLEGALEGELAAHGILPAPERRRVRAAAIDEVLVPAIDDLFR
jgi:hypothetical protein